MENNNSMWGGRFNQPVGAFVQRFTASIEVEKRLANYDIQGSVAHATMLMRCNIITKQEGNSIIEGLFAIQEEIAQGQFNWSIALEDVHMNIEHRLIERIGDSAKKLHTARSRNDQVATDMRLYTRDAIDHIVSLITTLHHNLLDQAQKHITVIMPGMTHLQFAQPIRFSYHLLAWCAQLLRDKERFLQTRKRVNISPLGSAALAGTSFAIDRALSAQLLGFDAPSENGLDSVSDRDFIADFIYTCATLFTHLSRWSEELILWSSTPFSWIDIPQEFCTGSSIMPQKKNPDVPELVRGKSARVYGNLHAILTLMKAQPLAYNKDNQEDKEMLFDTVDTTQDCLIAMSDMLARITPNAKKMHQDASLGFTVATDLADYLVKRGLPFRDAHAAVGQLVQLAEKNNGALADLSLASMQAVCPLIADDVYAALDVESAVEARSHIGATARTALLAQIEKQRKL